MARHNFALTRMKTSQTFEAHHEDNPLLHITDNPDGGYPETDTLCGIIQYVVLRDVSCIPDVGICNLCRAMWLERLKRQENIDIE